MELSNEFWIQIIVYVASLAVMWGQITTRIKYLEEKVDSQEQATLDRDELYLESLMLLEEIKLNQELRG